MKKLQFFVIFALSSTLIRGQETAPLITISDGELIGSVNYTYHEKVLYYAYRGIPFAKKPIGDLRFASPVKNDPWTGTLDATKDKVACTQIGLFYSSSTNVTGSEDCLYINVYSTNVTGNLPVMVWIYGGTLLGGSSDYQTYGPDYFLEKGVVYVSFNYRLGIFGFLSTEDLTAPGNWGLKDQVLALNWVNQNIKSFGGDPNQVTIFGQSAGGYSVSYLALSNLTTGLFKGAILESGSSLMPVAHTTNARVTAFSVGLSLGIYTLSSKTLVQKLRQVDYKTLKIAESNVSNTYVLLNNFFGGTAMGVVTEPVHPGAIITKKNWELLSTGKFHRVPLIVGFTSNETAILASLPEQLSPLFIKYDIDVTLLAPSGLTQNYIKKVRAGAEVKNYFFDNFNITRDPKRLVQFGNVNQFVRPIRETVVQCSKFTNVYFYEFAYKGHVGDPNNTTLGVFHAEDLKYEFIMSDVTPTPADMKTIQKVVTLWTNFAKTGNPTPSPQSDVLEGLIWEPNDPSSNAAATVKYLNIDTNFSMKTNPFQEDWIFYENLYNTLGDPPYITY
uniref:Carboxylic ester hydrolase n=1 Tax=Dendroctonus armandi TaxID=77159 RepID=A0A3G2KX68_9CUCU|nr:carboxylesterase [Dendroctonus armandi]